MQSGIICCCSHYSTFRPSLSEAWSSYGSPVYRSPEVGSSSGRARKLVRRRVEPGSWVLVGSRSYGGLGYLSPSAVRTTEV